jgi:ferrochelatase
MTFENFSRLTHATLLNEPFVSSFYDIVFDPYKVKRGDLFIGRELEDIKIALSRDAYAILSDRKIPILDEEIAWLRTESIEQALINLMRYHVMENRLELYYLDEISIALFQKIAVKERPLLLSDNLQTNLQLIMQAHEESIFISSDDVLLAKIKPGYRHHFSTDTAKITPTRSTLFLTSFYADGKHYDNIKLPALFLPRLQNLLAFMKELQISFDLHKCDFTPFFYPIFVNKELRIKPFGSTPSVIIVTAPGNTLSEITDYISTHAAWAKTLCFSPLSSPAEAKITMYHYRNLSEITKLKEIEFNFAIINDDLQKILQSLKNLETKGQRSLFKE